MALVRDLLQIIESLAPSGLAEDWDNVGLMVGDPSAQVSRVALALDPTLENVRLASKMGASVLLTHHPLIFRPLKSLNLSHPAAAVCALALESRVAVISAHTNLDAAENGVSRALADRLELTDQRVLDPIIQDSHDKLAVYVPAGYEDPVRQALAGAGAHGGHFLTSPVERTGMTGTEGPINREKLVKIEVVVNKADLEAVMKAFTSAASFSPPLYDVSPLVPRPGQVGYGCIGRLEKPLDIGALAALVKAKLPTTSPRVAAVPDGPVSRVAVMGGSGGSAMTKAFRQGAQVFISGDLGYHQARDAETLGLCLIDAGHFATEWPIIPKLASILTRTVEERGLDLSLYMIENEKDPWIVMEV